jgi:hypothetical protein
VDLHQGEENKMGKRLELMLAGAGLLSAVGAIPMHMHCENYLKDVIGDVEITPEMESAYASKVMGTFGLMFGGIGTFMFGATLLENRRRREMTKFLEFYHLPVKETYKH